LGNLSIPSGGFDHQNGRISKIMDGSVSNQASKNPETPNKNKEIET